MQQLIYSFARRRRGHPKPTWRAHPYRPSPLDIRLVASSAAGTQPAEPWDEARRPAQPDEIWER